MPTWHEFQENLKIQKKGKRHGHATHASCKIEEKQRLEIQKEGKPLFLLLQASFEKNW